MKTITYQPNIGDILLCSGNSWMSNQIKRTQKLFCRMDGRDLKKMKEAVEISHIAMATSLNVFEATTLNKWCGKRGVQENPYSKWIENYNGRVWVRRLSSCEDVRLAILEAVTANLGRKYENGIPGFFELLLAGISWDCFNDRPHLARKLRTKDGLHCSEVTAIVLQNAFVLKENARPNKLPPMEWWGNGKLDELLNSGFLYSEPILIKGR